jgi:hypothetical protein
MRIVIDAIAADLQATIAFPADLHLQKYAPPLNLTPERCPMLSVYAIRYPRQIIATPGTYQWDLDLEIAYYESGASYGETAGGTDPDLPGRLLDTIEAIGDRLETYAVAIPGVAGIPPNLTSYGTIGAGETSPSASAMVWRAMQELTVTGTALRSIP